jgi:uncharacterized membrane protein YraQ (UPF0718 family)
MTQATAILIFLAGLLLIMGASRRDGSLQKGLHRSWTTFKRTFPLLLAAFAIVGYVEQLAPQDFVQTWLGPESGAKGILLGEAAGALMPGGPYVIFPLITALYQAGAGIGPTLAMITSWSSLALLSASFELPFLGWRFTLIRMGLGIVLPIIVGVIGMWFF